MQLSVADPIRNHGITKWHFYSKTAPHGCSNNVL